MQQANQPPGFASLNPGYVLRSNLEDAVNPMITPAHYIYRQLTRADAALLKALLQVFGEAFDQIGTYQHFIPSDDYLTRLLSKQHFIAVVAMKDEEVVGGLAAYELDKFEQDPREIYIYDLAVAQSHRRKGDRRTQEDRVGAECACHIRTPTWRITQRSRCMNRLVQNKQRIILTSRYRGRSEDEGTF
jgi:GNAT superfamily N-acetyltransferase